jgi:hypothetical protein
VKPYWDSRVESSFCSSSENSLEDRWALVSLPFFSSRWSPIGTRESSQVFARAPKIVSEIGEPLSPSSYLFCYYFVLSFDACIVTITWSLLFVVIALWVICPTRKITLAPHSSSGLPMLVCFLVFYWLMGKHLGLLTDIVSEFKSFSEAPCLTWKCGKNVPGHCGTRKGCVGCALGIATAPGSYVASCSMRIQE